MTDICCIGHITRDRIITQVPPVTTHCAGGSAYYMAWAIQALPHDVNFHLITSVSREVMPEVEKLRQAGVRVTAFESDTNVFSRISMVPTWTTAHSGFWPSRLHSHLTN